MTESREPPTDGGEEERRWSPGAPRERLGDEERLREEALDLPRALNDELVLVGELLHPKDGDDVLELLVALQDLLTAVVVR